MDGWAQQPKSDLCKCGHRRDAHDWGGAHQCLFVEEVDDGGDELFCPCTRFDGE